MDEQLGARSQQVAVGQSRADRLSGRWRLSRLFLLSNLLLSSVAALATTYVYDGSGRLVAITDDTGVSARYTYDNIGNLLSVDRLATGQLAIFAVSPGRGGPGTAIRIRGQGFSATAGENVVKFSGVTATISAASSTELFTAVPVEATTGPIAVTVGTVTAMSATNFTVDAAIGVPMIATVSPAVVVAGQSVTLNGSGLLPIAGQTSTLLNGRAVVPTNLSSIQIAFPTPPNVGSGRVTVTTPYGMATSAEDVLVVPAGVEASAIESTTRLTMNAAAQPMGVNGTGKSIAVLYDAATGDYPSLQFSAMNSSVYLTYSVYSIDNTLLASQNVRSTNPTVHLPRVALGGTFLIVIKPSTAQTTWGLAVEKAQAVAVGGADVTQSISSAAQSKRIVFTPADDKNLGLGISDLITPNTSATAYLKIYGPDGSLLSTSNCQASYGGCQANLQNTLTGTYTAIIEPPKNGDRTISFKAILSADATGTITPDVEQPLDLTRRGQNGILRFSGTAGQIFLLKLLGQTTIPAGRPIYYSAYKPDGSLLASVSATSAAVLNMPPLPVTGTYTLYVDPQYGEVTSTRVLLTAGSGGALIIGGATGSYSTNAPGQNVYLTFTVTQGQNLGFGISDMVTPNTTANGQVQIYQADGVRVENSSCDIDNCEIDLPLASAGTYSVVISPPSSGDRTMSFKSTLSTDITGVLEPNVLKTVTLGRRGQNGRLAFSGTAGQSFSLQIISQGTTPVVGTMVQYNVYTPSGTSAASGGTISTGTIKINNISATGVYTVFVDPSDGQTLSAQLMLTPSN